MPTPFNGINQRIICLGGELGDYSAVVAIKDAVLYKRKDNLYRFEFSKAKSKLFSKNVTEFSLNETREYILMHTDDRTRLITTAALPSDDLDEEDAEIPESGWIDLSRIKLKINPKEEWKQMYHEAWLLQREHFWRKDMNKIDWSSVNLKYKSLLQLVNTRTEYSDLINEMQGELGTSHCFEIGGDYDRQPHENYIGKLGAEFKFDAVNNEYTISKIFQGESWNKKEAAPLSSLGVCLNKGDKILAIDSELFSTQNSLHQLLLGKSDTKVDLLVKRKNAKNSETVCVKTLVNESSVRYRDWVDSNKAYVHKKSKNKVGYLHLPDMSVAGFDEFYKSYLSEHNYSGLIIDIRYNTGGNISQQIIRMLTQKHLGFDCTRYNNNIKYPEYSNTGAMVALTNEFTASDGDIFSLAFKKLGLGKVVGKRTWGGVVGIEVKYNLVDGSFTSQPEFSFWFKDIGFAIENHGVDPDLEIDNSPEDNLKNKDSQLDKALEVVLNDLQKVQILKV